MSSVEFKDIKQLTLDSEERHIDGSFVCVTIDKSLADDNDYWHFTCHKPIKKGRFYLVVSGGCSGNISFSDVNDFAKIVVDLEKDFSEGK